MKAIFNLKSILIFSFIFLFLCSTLFSQNNVIETSGDILMTVLPATALTTSILLKDNNGTIQFAKGFLASNLTTRLIKGLIEKERPDGSNLNSFPSGHTAMAFQGASFIQRRYGWKYGIPAYALAGFVGYSRIQANKHDIVDVIAGMILGVGTTYLFTTPYKEDGIKLTFNRQDRNYLLGFTLKF